MAQPNKWVGPNTSHCEKFLKVDDLPRGLSRAMFAQICVEIDLSKPLIKGFWIDNGEEKILIVVIYERLSMFCFSCGLVGHGVANSPSVTSSPSGNEVNHGLDASCARDKGKQPLLVNKVGYVHGGCPEGAGQVVNVQEKHHDQEKEFGPWMLVQCR